MKNVATLLKTLFSARIAGQKNFPVIRFLLKNKLIHINQPPYLVHLATRFKKISLIERLLDQKVGASIIRKYAKLKIQSQILLESESTLRHLIDNDVPFNQADYKGLYPLTYSLLYRDHKMSSLLLAAKAPIFMKINLDKELTHFNLFLRLNSLDQSSTISDEMANTLEHFIKNGALDNFYLSEKFESLEDLIHMMTLLTDKQISSQTQKLVNDKISALIIKNQDVASFVKNNIHRSDFAKSFPEIKKNKPIVLQFSSTLKPEVLAYQSFECFPYRKTKG